MQDSQKDGLFELPQKKIRSDFEDAVQTCFDELEKRNVLDPVSRAKRAGTIRAAKMLDAGFSTGYVSVALSNMFKTVMSTLDTLPTVPADSEESLNTLDMQLKKLTEEGLDQWRAEMTAQ